MRIESIKIVNFRQHQNTIIDFTITGPYDLHLLIGKNGAGKTNLLAAINWCLYGKESSISEESQKLPLVNVISIKDAENNAELKVSAIINMKSQDGELIEFRREQVFYKKDSSMHPIPGDQDFVVIVSRESDNDQVLRGDRAILKVKQFVPERINEFFFFDGERLDKYFKTETGAKIHKAVFDISQLDALNELGYRLTQTYKILRKESSDFDPVINELNHKIEIKEQVIEQLQFNLNKLRTQKKAANEKIAEIGEELQGIPDAANLEKQRNKLVSTRKELQDRLSKRNLEKQDLLVEYGRLVLLNSTIEKSLSIIDEKRKNKELPPKIDSSVLTEIIKTHHCSVCDSVLSPEQVGKIEKMKESINKTSLIGRQLHNLENPLKRIQLKIKNFYQLNNEITKTIVDLQKKISELDIQINEIDKTLNSFNSASVQKLQAQRIELQAAYENILKNIAVQERDMILSKNGFEKLKNDLENSLAKKEKEKKRVKAMKYCSKAESIVASANELIMEEIRHQIEVKTKDFFLELVWKKETFRDITIDQNFNLHLFDNLGYECLGSISAAERELLALSFTLALHLISGFDAPLVIDTPLSRVSDENRSNFSEVLKNVSQHKQIVLFLTLDEYSDDVKKIFASIPSNRSKIEVQTGERISKVGGVGNA